MNESLFNKRHIYHLCTKKQCKVTEAGMLHPLRWRRPTSGTLAKATWLGDTMGDIVAKIKQKQLRGLVAASVSGEQENNPPRPRQPGPGPPSSPAEGLGGALMSRAKVPKFGDPKKKLKVGSGLLSLLKSKQKGEDTDAKRQT